MGHYRELRSTSRESSHAHRDPIYLYPELDDGGWSHELVPSSCGNLGRREFMTLAATFLGGAKSRLLPASIPFRFFVAAALFHIAIWLVLFAAANEAVGFRGGLGSTLAAVHCLALGVLVTTAIGASSQILPVATRRTLHAIWPIKLIFWLIVPGMIALIGGMYAAQTKLLIPAAVVVTAGLLLFCGLLANNLRGAASLPVVAAYGWAALAALIAAITLGLSLAINEQFTVLPDHDAAVLAHLILGGFGFMGLLALGLSHILVPMFALAPAPAKKPSFASFIIACAALILGTLGALNSNRDVLAMAALLGLVAAATHLWLMHLALKTGMRKRLGLSFVLVRAAWVMLPLTLFFGLAALYGLAGKNGPTLFGFLLLFGWLLTFLFGILQRIMPFLASMFVPPPAAGGTSVVSALSSARSLKLHAICHGLAFAMLAAAILLDNATIAQAGATIGLTGAVVFAWFTADVVRRMRPTK